MSREDMPGKSAFSMSYFCAVSMQQSTVQHGISLNDTGCSFHLFGSPLATKNVINQAIFNDRVRSNFIITVTIRSLL